MPPKVPNKQPAVPAAFVPTSRQDAESPAQLDIGQRRLERIAIRAHEIYEARGGEHGKELADWLQAEREIDSEQGAPSDKDA